MNVKERLLLYLAYKKLGQNAFEKKVGISNGYISRSKGNIGAEILMRIINNSNDLNRDWLLYGEGEMLKTEKKNETEENNFPSNICNTDQSDATKAMQANLISLYETISSQSKTISELVSTVSKQGKVEGQLNETINDQQRQLVDLTATVTKQNEIISNLQKHITEIETKKERPSSGTVAHATTRHVEEIQK